MPVLLLWGQIRGRACGSTPQDHNDASTESSFMKPNQISRRKFLKRSSVAAGALALAPTFAFAAESSKFDPFQTVKLGKTDLKFSRVCMGTGVRGGMRQSNHTRMGREKCEALMRATHDRGVRVFDLADLYGTHPFVISALKTIPRKDFNIVTKIWFRPGGIPEPSMAFKRVSARWRTTCTCVGPRSSSVTRTRQTSSDSPMP